MLILIIPKLILGITIIFHSENSLYTHTHYAHYCNQLINYVANYDVIIQILII